MKEIQKKIIQNLVSTLPENIIRKLKAKKADKTLHVLQKGNYIGTEDADINQVCKAILFVLHAEKEEDIFNYFNSMPEKDHFFRSIVQASEEVIHDELLEFIRKHPLINVSALEREIGAPKSTIAIVLACTDGSRKIPARYFQSLIDILKTYGMGAGT